MTWFSVLGILNFHFIQVFLKITILHDLFSNKTVIILLK